jgi:hypothetical protein
MASSTRRGVAKPGQRLDIAAPIAPNEADAAHYYPAVYWYSLLPIPDQKEFGGENGIPAKVTQEDWLVTIKNRACVGCHQLGQEPTRTIPAAFANEKTSVDAWMRRVQSGQAAPFMVNPLAGQLGGAPFKYFAEWTDHIAAGQLPREKPPRPQGIELNLVITEWDWGQPDKYLHDLISTDKRYPTVNAGGKLYGSPEYATDELPILDPASNTVTYFHAPVRDPDMPPSLGEGHAATEKPVMPSAYWGDRQIWDTRVNNHNMMIDKKGRVWLTASVRGVDNPAFCKEGSDHPSAKLFPLKDSRRQLAMFDPQTMKYTFIDTCFQTHHLQFGFDNNETLWTSGGGPVVGWFNTKLFDETGDAQKAQGWTTLVLDTDGNGKRDAAVEPGQPVDPAKDKRIAGGFYAVMPSPVDGSVWGTVGVFGGKGAIVRLDPGVNPPDTALAEIYNVPAPGFGPRGADIDSKDVVWVSLGSGHLGSFDRRKCKEPLIGPKATGDQCPEGWTLYQYPGPGFAGIGKNSAEASYYTWVDQHNTLGLRRGRPNLDRQRERRAACTGQRQMGRDPRALSAQLLRQGAGRPDRQCGRRLEGAQPVDNERRSDAVAQGRRQGHRADRLSFPAASQPGRELRASARGREGSARSGQIHAQPDAYPAPAGFISVEIPTLSTRRKSRGARTRIGAMG